MINLKTGGKLFPTMKSLDAPKKAEKPVQATAVSVDKTVEVIDFSNVKVTVGIM